MSCDSPVVLLPHSQDYGVNFFKGFTLVLNALDNRAARNHVNRMCLAAHVVYGAPGQEWKDLVPAHHMPWAEHSGGFYQLDLSAAPTPAASWPSPGR